MADKLRNDPNKAGNAQYILDVLKLVLQKLYFEFDGEHHLQIGGTAMGTSLAPDHANLFMDKVKAKTLANYHLKSKYPTGLHETIKFTIECGTKEVNFLDTTASFDQNTKLSNPTTTNQQAHICIVTILLHTQTVSCKRTLWSIPKAERTCSRDEE